MIEGCPIARTLLKINSVGDSIWTSDLNFWHNSKLGMFEDFGAPFSFLTSEPINFTCEGLIVSLFGFYRTSLYKLSTSGEIIDTLVFNDECELQVVDYVKLINDDILLLANLQNEFLDRTTRLFHFCLLYTSPSPRDKRQSRMPSSA